jgi:hypothetical protein
MKLYVRDLVTMVNGSDNLGFQPLCRASIVPSEGCSRTAALPLRTKARTCPLQPAASDSQKVDRPENRPLSKTEGSMTFRRYDPCSGQDRQGGATAPAPACLTGSQGNILLRAYFKSQCWMSTAALSVNLMDNSICRLTARTCTHLHRSARAPVVRGCNLVVGKNNAPGLRRPLHQDTISWIECLARFEQKQSTVSVRSTSASAGIYPHGYPLGG